MKKLKLVLGSYRDNWLSLVLISLVLACGLLFTLFFGSQVRCESYTSEIFRTGKEKMRNSLYYMPYSSENVRQKKDLEPIRQMSGVKDLLYIPSFESGSGLWNGWTLNLTYYPVAMQEQFPLPLSQGKWPDKSGEVPEAVVGGQPFAKTRVGDLLTIQVRDVKAGKTMPYQVRVSGVLRFPAYVPTFGAGGTNVKANDLFATTHAWVFMSQDHLLPYMDDEAHYGGHTFFVDFTEDATPAQIQSVRNELSKNGSILTYEEITEYTNKQLLFEVNRKLMGPAFFLLSVSMAFICVSGLLLKKNMATYSVYALAGCSKKRSMLLAALGVLPPVVVAGAVAFGFMGAYQYIYEYLPPSMNLFIMDGWTALTVGLYLLAVYALALLVPVVSIARHAPINLYREERE